VKYICGIQATACFTGKNAILKTGKSNFTISRNYLFGDLSLTSYEEGNQFYFAEVLADDVNISMSDFSISQTHKIAEWRDGGKRGIEEVMIDGDSTLINGMFRDRTGKEISFTGGYEVKVIIWLI